MSVGLFDTERRQLRQAQRACRGKAGYVPVTVLLLLDWGRAVAVIAKDLGLDESTVYRYVQTYRLKGLAGYLAAEQPGYWGLLTRAPNLRAWPRNSGRPCTPTAGPLPTGWPAPTPCATRFRA